MPRISVSSVVTTVLVLNVVKLVPDTVPKLDGLTISWLVWGSTVVWYCIVTECPAGRVPIATGPSAKSSPTMLPGMPPFASPRVGSRRSPATI